MHLNHETYLIKEFSELWSHSIEFCRKPIRLGSLWIPWVLGPCCCNDTVVASSCCTRNANSPCCCCVRCFSREICWRSPNNRWFSYSSATNISFKHCSSKKTYWYSWVLTVAIVLEEGRIRRYVWREWGRRRWGQFSSNYHEWVNHSFLFSSSSVLSLSLSLLITMHR